MTQTVKNLPAVQETQVQSLCLKILWRIPWTEDPGRLYPCGRKGLDMTEHEFHMIYYHHVII